MMIEVKNDYIKRILDGLDSLIIGQEELKTVLILSLLTEGNLLIEGPVGVGKTVTAKVFSMLIGGEFKRIQMTSDLLPSDILGTPFYNIKDGSWSIKKGPIFANVVFIDELNRAPARTQSALLQAMQEKEVTIENTIFKLPSPFMVIATQVPYPEGTYTLPYVEIDRFSYGIEVDLPSKEDEIRILDVSYLTDNPDVKPVITPEKALELTKVVKEVKVSDEVKEYIVSLIRSLREDKDLMYKLSVRASIWLYRGSKAIAFLDSRNFVIPDDVKFVFPYVVYHRIVLKPESAIEKNKKEKIKAVLESVKVPK
ncbi:MoxR family ATPase [Sulfolobaceae archaeon RB850M]